MALLPRFARSGPGQSGLRFDEFLKEIQARLEKAQNNQKQEQAEVAQLSAEVERASGNKKQALQDRLDALKADLEKTA